MLFALSVAALFLAMIPAFNVACNLWLYRLAPKPRIDPFGGRNVRPFVSVLIPARDEEKNIEKAVRKALTSEDVDLEVVVMDDDSSDTTAEIVRRLGREDSRVRLIEAPTLPSGWCGKTHACARLAEEARGDYFLFVEADVVLGPDAAVRMVAQMETTKVDLISSVPRQKTVTVLERTIIPLIHFILLGYLPIVGMRKLHQRVWAAGCGQLFMARRTAYEGSGGHEAFYESRHDGLWLPRVFRMAGYKTDLFDASDLALCRMYDRDRDLVQGFTKNATEGMASPGAIVPWTVLLLGGQVLPFLLVSIIDPTSDVMAARVAVSAVGIVVVTRLVLTLRFRQSLLGALLHPVGILLIVAIQWYARFQASSGVTVAWKGRA